MRVKGRSPHSLPFLGRLGRTGLGLFLCVRRLISTLLAELPVYPAPVNVSSSWAMGPLTFTQRSTRWCWYESVVSP